MVIKQKQFEMENNKTEEATEKSTFLRSENFVCVCVHITTQIWRSEDNFGNPFSPSTLLRQNLLFMLTCST